MIPLLIEPFIQSSLASDSVRVESRANCVLEFNGLKAAFFSVGNLDVNSSSDRARDFSSCRGDRINLGDKVHATIEVQSFQLMNVCIDSDIVTFVYQCSRNGDSSNATWCKIGSGRTAGGLVFEDMGEAKLSRDICVDLDFINLIWISRGSNGTWEEVRR